MKSKRWLWPWLMLVLPALLGACGPFPAPLPPLTATVVQKTLEQWNPNYFKVVEFYGLYHPGPGDSRLAYVSATNPSDAAAKPTNYEVRFQLLTQSDGKKQWFLTSVVTHSSGLTRRQGWDYLMEPVKGEGAKPAS